MKKINLKCDKEGFLIGEIIGKNECDKARQSVAVPKQGMPSAQSVAVPKQGRKIGDDQSARKPLQKAATPNVGLLRDEKGRYLPKSQQPKQDSNSPESADEKTQEASKNNRLIDAIKSGLSSAAQTDTQGIDPGIDAMKEASAPFVVAGGAIKTASSLFTRKDKSAVAMPQMAQLTKEQVAQNSMQNRGWRRFFKRFDLFAKNQSVFNKAADETLKEIEKKPIAQVTNSMSGAMPLGGGGFKNLLKKLPVIGGLLGGLFAIDSISDTENDDTLSRREKDKTNGKTIGGVSGMLAGAVAGAALGSVVPVVGTIIGGIAGAFFGGSAGELLGETVGGWVSDLRGSDIAGAILSGWESVSTGLSSSFEALSKSASESWEQMTVKFTPIIDSLSRFFEVVSTGFFGVLDSLNGWVKNLTGIDMGDKLKSGYESVKKYVKESTAGKTVSYVADKSVSAYEKTKDFFTGDSRARKQALEDEMTKRGITNANERAMIMAQADHESGGFMHSQESFKYKTPEQLMRVSKTARDKGRDAVQAALNGGDEAIAELMYGGRMGNAEKGDGYKYRGRGSFQLTGKDNYRQAGNELGLDLVNNPDLAMDKDNSAKIAVWYAQKNKIAQAAQVGNVEAVTRVINGGQNGLEDRRQLFAKYGGVEGAVEAENTVSTPEQLGLGIQASAVNSNRISQGTAQIGISELNTKVATPDINMPTVPTTPSFSVADIPPAPSITEALNSPSAIKVKVEQPNAMIGQDVSDRALSHIITGGMGA